MFAHVWLILGPNGICTFYFLQFSVVIKNENLQSLAEWFFFLLLLFCL